MSTTASTVEALRAELLAKTGESSPLQIETLRSGPRSGVERLHLPDGQSRVFRWSAGEHTEEDLALSHALTRGVPVPNVDCSAVRDGMLGMLLADLGPPVRKPKDADAASAVACLYQAGLMPGARRLGEPQLVQLPTVARSLLAGLRADGRFTDNADLDPVLATLERVAVRRVVGAEIAPFGLCHLALNPASTHIGPNGWTLADLTEPATGPVLLSLAAWHGPDLAPRLPRMRLLIAAFIAAGGPATARALRGDLPAENWALGWHRLHTAVQHLRAVAADPTDPSADDDQAVLIGRLLRSATTLLHPAQASTARRSTPRRRPGSAGGDG